MKKIVEQRLKPILKNYFEMIKAEGLDLVIDGVSAFNPRAQFVAGMVMEASCFTAVEILKDEESLKDLGIIIRMVSTMEMRTWGILSGITSLYRLHQHSLLNKVIDENTLNLLKKVLDWRTFVDEKNHYQLINKPTNYYGVAFGIARYRELLGWDEERHSVHLLNRLFEHIDCYSGDFGFMDETLGEGRFDFYTMLVPCEMTTLLLETGMKIPEKLRMMLRKSCEILLQLANKDGQGFHYGRSIGAYGDAGIFGVFSVAAEVGEILSKNEMEIAYAYCVKVMNRLVDFWYDQEMQSMNLWDKGRRTDHYRNKNRILSENLDLCMKAIRSYERWKNAGFGEREICSDYMERIAKLDTYKYVLFSNGKYKRALAIVRDEDQVWSLPFVNGSTKYFDKDAYLHVPFQNEVLQGVTDCKHIQLIPQLLMENGDIYVPHVFNSRITPIIENERMQITCEYDGLCYVDHDDEIVKSPKKVDGTKAVVKYIFEKNRICREDKWIVDNGTVKVKEARLVFLTFSEDPSANECEVSFGKGVITRMKVNGYELCEVKKALDDGRYDTPQGRLQYEVVWTNNNIDLSEELTFQWEITY